MLMLAFSLASCVNNGNGGTTTSGNDATSTPDSSEATTPGDSSEEAPDSSEEAPDTTEPEVQRPAEPDVNAKLPTIEATTLEIIKDKKSQFTAIYSGEGFAAGAGETGAWNFWTEVLKKYKVQITVKADTSVAASADSCELLIGDTNRPESDLALAFAKGGNGYVIMAIGNKLVINGYNDSAVEAGVTYFLENIFATKSGDTDFVFTSDMNYISPAEKYAREKYNCAGYSYAYYNIVLPEKADFYEERAARIVQTYVANRVGALLPIIYDNETDKASDFEILIGDTNRTQTKVTENEYVFATYGAKAEIVAGSVFAMEFAIEHIENEDMALLYFDENFNAGELKREDTAERLVNEGNKSFGEKQGDYRIVSNNVWGWNENTMPGLWNYNSKSYNSAAQRNKMMMDVYLALDADIILLQEYTTRLMRIDAYENIIPALADYGYAEAVPKKSFTESGSALYTATPVLYKTEKFDLVTNGCTKFETGGGHDKFLTWAVLQEKGTDNKILAASVHHAYQGGTEGENYRKAQVPIVTNTLTQIAKGLGNCPIVLAGDFNCNYNSAPYKLYLDAGFESVNKVASNPDEAKGYYGGPFWNEMSNTVYMTVDNTKFGTFAEAIDHVIFKGEGLKFASYDVLTDHASASISDHMPVVVDFSFE